MSYENPDVPHDVNVARESAVVEFVRLFLGIGLCVLALGAVLYFAGGFLARLIPFSTERGWVGDHVVGVELEPVEHAPASAVECSLNQLAAQLARAMRLPASMPIAVHYTDLDVPNAFATLGGHIVVTRALYELMPSENALAMVLAHELAHVQARDPIAALGGGALLALAAALVSGEASGLLGQATLVVQRGYSRRAETSADRAAIAALIAHYGHAGGAAETFEILARQAGDVSGAIPSFFTTHPADAQRIADLRRPAANWDPLRQPLVPLAHVTL